MLTRIMLIFYNGNSYWLVSYFAKKIADAQQNVKSIHTIEAVRVYNNHVTMNYKPVFQV